MAAIFVCGAECGATAVCAGHWDAVVGTAPTLETTVIEPGGGATSYKFVWTSAVSQYLAHTLAQTTVAARIYFNFHALVSAGPTSFIQFTNANGSATVRCGTNGQLYIRMSDASAGNVAVGSPISVDTWHYLDIKVDGSGATSYMYATLDGGTEVSDSHAQVSANITQLRIGNVATGYCTATTYFDQILLAAAAGYPIGPGAVAGYRPASDGTHTSTSTNIVKGTTATPVGTAITSATTDAYQWVDAATIATTGSFINQQTIATQYVEVGFGTIAVAPLAVEVLVALSAASTAAGTQKSVLWDGVTAADMYALATVGVAHPTLLYKRAIYTASMSGAWTAALFNSLHFRWGYSTDATPDAYLDNVVLEVAYVPAAGGPLLKVRRSAAWTAGAVKVRRSGAWVAPTAVKVRRSGAWTTVT